MSLGLWAPLGWGSSPDAGRERINACLIRRLTIDVESEAADPDPFTADEATITRPSLAEERRRKRLAMEGRVHRGRSGRARRSEPGCIKLNKLHRSSHPSLSEDGEERPRGDGEEEWPRGGAIVEQDRRLAGLLVECTARPGDHVTICIDRDGGGAADGAARAPGPYLTPSYDALFW